ncbi:MAG: hypothetical protein K6E95_07330 [Lachnospiraceae bacterium]|nr:hypothetical protein [Lachnospiraceae bacterium]
MTDYPDNSYTSRERRDPKDEQKFKKVTSGGIKTRKKSEVKKITSLLMPEDKNSVRSFILMDVIIPGIKNAIADVVGIILFGESGRLGRSRSGGSKISYQKYYRDDDRDRREYGRPRNVGGFDYDDIVFETRGDADLVLDQLDSAISQYGVVSVADLYDLAGVTCRSYTANKYGWTDIHNAKVSRVSDGYIILLPRTVQID